jgi:drug/metabolite transporter (DMT)-like permease
VLLATVLALTAAVLHASWNISVKQSGDKRLALWGQFAISGALSGVVIVAWTLIAGAPPIAWGWAAASGATHVPYILLLSRAYDRGDFSMSYPIARGGGALAAALGGVLILHDTISFVSAFGILLVVAGLLILATSGSWHVVGAALSVASTIGFYSVVDGHGTRQSNAIGYTLALNVFSAAITTLWVASSRRSEMMPAMKNNWKRFGLAGIAATAGYALIMIAYQHAPVGYVATLRESSVVLAAFAGWKMLDEGDHRRRITSALIVLVGLAVLVTGS